jgi:4-amino-4-deoxy-L-arabinose transferase-like glycosyltransferase
VVDAHIALLSASALATVAAMYAVGARVSDAPGAGAATAAVFALTPLLWREIAASPGALVPMVFVVGWLLAIALYLEHRSAPYLVIGGASMGAGLYTSDAAFVMMPVYLIVTLAVLGATRSLPRRHVGLLVAAFVLFSGPRAISLLRHPEVFRSSVNAHRLYDANRFTVLQGVREICSWVGLTARSGVYFNYFNPVFLFGGGHVLFWPLALPIGVGAWRIINDDVNPLARTCLAGFLAAPFAAALTAENPDPRRLIFLAPFAAPIATYGLDRLLHEVRTRALF